MSNKRDRAVQTVPVAEARTVPYKAAENEDASRPIGVLFEGAFDDRDVAGVPQSIEPNGDQLVGTTAEPTLEEALAAMTVRHDDLWSAFQELDVECQALLTIKQTYEALAQGTVWEVLWQNGRAWVVATSIESALEKVRAKNPGVTPNSVKAAGVTLVL